MSDTIPDILYGPDGAVYFAGVDVEPLPQLEPEHLADGTIKEHGCGLCCWTGYDLWAHVEGRSDACPHCGGEPALLVPYVDEDGDHWLDDVPKMPAKMHGGTRPLEATTTLVVHRLSRGRGLAGPNYFASKGLGREVSVHACIAEAGFSPALVQQLPLTSISWNAGHRKVNAASISVELAAAKGGDPHAPHDAETIDELVRWATSCKAMLPSLRYTTGHVDVLPHDRVDPGRAFPWDAFCERTGLERVTHAELARIWS